jgi:IclR family pca regulon transcriptional regulator
MPEGKETTVHSLQRGLALLERFTREQPRRKLQELTQAAKLPKTTVLRLLRTLVSLGYVRFDAVSREYCLGPKVMSLGYATLAGMDLKEIARPYIDDLSRVTGQNVYLGVLDGSEVVYIERVTRKQLIATDHTVGSRVNLHSTAVGRAILAHLAPEKRKKFIGNLFRQRTLQIGMRREEFVELLAEVRRNGFSVSNEEFIPGIRAIGAPVFDSRGEADAAMNMPVFSKSVSLRQLTRQFAPLLVRAAAEISASRGFAGAGC